MREEPSQIKTMNATEFKFMHFNFKIIKIKTTLLQNLQRLHKTVNVKHYIII